MGYRVLGIFRENENVVQGEDEGEGDRASEGMVRSGMSCDLGLVLECDVVHLSHGKVVETHVDAVVEDSKILRMTVRMSSHSVIPCPSLPIFLRPPLLLNICSSSILHLSEPRLERPGIFLKASAAPRLKG
jgi:hypothetical protein